MISHIVFDFDGVIHDTYELGFRIARSVHPQLTEEEWRARFDGNLFKQLNEDERVSQKDINLFRRKEREAFAKLQMSHIVFETLKRLAGVYTLTIISSNTEYNINSYLKRSGAQNFFAAVFAAETHYSKVEKFHLLFREHGVEAHNTVFVTDTLGDLLEAQAVRVPTIAVDFGFHERERLLRGNPHVIVSDFASIETAIQNINKNLAQGE